MRRVILGATGSHVGLGWRNASFRGFADVISGRMVVRVGDRSLELGPGEVVTMEPGLTHAGKARADTAFLLTLVEASSK